MPRDEDLLGSRSGRRESPEVEMLMQESIGDAIALALSNFGLYQNVKFNLSLISNYLSDIDSKILPKGIENEFSKRPLIPISPGQSHENTMRAHHFCGVNDDPLNTPQDEGNLVFPLPSIKTRCKKCNDENVFNSIGSIWCDGLLGYYPHISARTEQIFTFYYQCALCREHLITFMVKRHGLSLQLCGRSERLPISTSKKIPKKLRPILSDAIGAINENDIYAGFYHLRTFVEHYMKSCLKMEKSKRINGDELSSEYNSTLDNRMKSGIPSLSVIYEKTSNYMHSRTGDANDFYRLIEGTEAHILAKELFNKYKS